MRTIDRNAARRRTGRGAGLLLRLILLVAALTLTGWGSAAMAQSSQPRTVTFPSADGKTMLTGYLFAPAGRPKTAPAVVLLRVRVLMAAS